jgi:hypothetical protein
MKYSAADPSVSPHKQLNLIVPWTVFNLLACVWFVALLVGLVRGPAARRTPMLFSLYAVFVLATAAGPMLSWTGRVMTPEVPIPLCVVSAAFGSSWSLTQVSAAFALVLKVCLALTSAAGQANTAIRSGHTLLWSGTRGSPFCSGYQNHSWQVRWPRMRSLCANLSGSLP